jgi:pantoate--beta-alanine ligase
MQIFKTKLELTRFLSSEKKVKSIGFVPTMGALHEGHLQLIKQSKKECEITVCSIFVNPTQFNNATDLANYPNTLKEDLLKLENLNCDAVYIPKVDDLYEENEKAKEFEFGTLSTTMEGEFRPGHFNGMATIVEKFFNIIKPTKAYFGQKDLQQLQIVKTLAKQTNSEIEIVGVPTIREESGLAMSSRNALLTTEGRKDATLIFECLNYCRANKNKGIDFLKSHTKTKFAENKNFELEYVEFVALNTILPITKWEKENENAICIATYIDGVRLIDNIIL